MPGAVVSKHVKYLINFLLDKHANDSLSAVSYPILSPGEKIVLAKLVRDHVIQCTQAEAYYISEEDAAHYFDRRRKKLLVAGITIAFFLGVIVICCC